MQDRLNTAAQIMWENDCGCVPVVDDLRRVIGIVTDRDITMAAYTQGKSLNDIEVGSICSRTVKTCAKTATLSEAEQIMANAQVRRLPVVESDGTLVGIISLSDLAHHLTFVAVGKSNSLGPRNLSLVLEAVSRPRRVSMPEAKPASSSKAVFLG
jgi:CBS-domain-containing membrane protein